jgi:hypothetical protein
MKPKAALMATIAQMDNVLLKYAIYEKPETLTNSTIDLITKYLSNQGLTGLKGLLPRDDIKKEIERLIEMASNFENQLASLRKGFLNNAILFWNTRTWAKNPSEIDWRDYDHMFSSATTKEEYIEKYLSEAENNGTNQLNFALAKFNQLILFCLAKKYYVNWKSLDNLYLKSLNSCE